MFLNNETVNWRILNRIRYFSTVENMHCSEQQLKYSAAELQLKITTPHKLRSVSSSELKFGKIWSQNRIYQ